MICHVFQTHARDEWCLRFHLETYWKFCHGIVVAVDGDESLTKRLNDMNTAETPIAAVNFKSAMQLPESRTDELGVVYDERAIRQCSMDVAMQLNPTLYVFGDTDEVPTPDVVEWIAGIAVRPQAQERYYANWVNLIDDYSHAIGGMSAWSFQNPRGNKKCLAMQPDGRMRYDGSRHTGMEPNRPAGGEAPKGPGKYLVDSPKLLHLKYCSEAYKTRAESKLARHQPDEMLKNGQLVSIPESWLWPSMPMN